MVTSRYIILSIDISLPYVSLLCLLRGLLASRCYLPRSIRATLARFFHLSPSLFLYQPSCHSIHFDQSLSLASATLVRALSPVSVKFPPRYNRRDGRLYETRNRYRVSVNVGGLCSLHFRAATENKTQTGVRKRIDSSYVIDNCRDTLAYPDFRG